MAFNQQPQAFRQGRFTQPGSGSGVEQGYQESSQQADTLDQAFVRRNLKPYKTLKRYTTKKGIKGLRNKNFAQLEQLAANAVIAKAKIKSKPLDTSVNKDKYKPKVLRQARRRLNTIPDSWRSGSTSGIQNKRVRRAANHLRQIRRNRAVNKTRVGSPKAYDIWKGYRRK
jgi:hypothetical protein